MTEIGLSAYVHLAASLPSLDYPIEEVGIYEHYGLHVTSNPLVITNGVFKVLKGNRVWIH